MLGDLWQAVRHGKQGPSKPRKKEAQEGCAAEGVSTYGIYHK
jgi:hypothetical protein